MWRRLAVVWAVMAACVLAFYGIEHITIFRAPEGHVGEQLAADDASALVRLGVEVVLLVILAACIWLNVRIIRRYRRGA